MQFKFDKKWRREVEKKKSLSAASIFYDSSVSLIKLFQFAIDDISLCSILLAFEDKMARQQVHDGR